MKSIKKNQLRTAVVVLTVGAMAYFSLQQYHSHKKNQRVSSQLVQLRVLRSGLAYYDESLTMSARLFVLTKDETWRRRYHQHLRSFDSSMQAIRRLLPRHFAGRPELEASAMTLTTLQRRALALVDSDRTEEAKLILLGQEYDHQKQLHTEELYRLRESLDGALATLGAARDRDAELNMLLNAVMLVLLVSVWIWYVRAAKHWYERISAANQKRAAAAVTAAQKLAEANEQLHALTIHLEQSRERERLKIANEINEELGQQLAAIKMRVNAIRKNIAAGKTAGEQLVSISNELGAVLESINGFAHDIYPLVLRDLGIVEALQWVSDKMSREGVTVYFLSEEASVHLEHKVEVGLFRAYQERVQAAIEQGASEVVGKLGLARGELVLTVYDDAPAAPANANSIAAVAMQERVRSMMGRLELAHTDTEGNCFSVFVPYAA